MATLVWTTINNGDTLSVVRGLLNTSGDNVVNQVNTNTSLLASHTSTIIDNTADIATNTTNIATNTADIATNTADILEINNKYTYDYATNDNITVVDTTYQVIQTITTPTRAAGTYKLSLSMLHTLNSITTSAYFRFSKDGGTTWIEIRKESKDIADVSASSYMSTIVHTGGIFNLIVEARKEVAGDILVVQAINSIFERKA